MKRRGFIRNMFGAMMAIIAAPFVPKEQDVYIEDAPKEIFKGSVYQLYEGEYHPIFVGRQMKFIKTTYSYQLPDTNEK